MLGFRGTLSFCEPTSHPCGDPRTPPLSRLSDGQRPFLMLPKTREVTAPGASRQVKYHKNLRLGWHLVRWSWCAERARPFPMASLDVLELVWWTHWAAGWPSCVPAGALDALGSGHPRPSRVPAGVTSLNTSFPVCEMEAVTTVLVSVCSNFDKMCAARSRCSPVALLLATHPGSVVSLMSL